MRNTEKTKSYCSGNYYSFELLFILDFMNILNFIMVSLLFNTYLYYNVLDLYKWMGPALIPNED